MNTTIESPWSTDLTRLCERLAERLASEGAEHPVEAAVALAARGHRGVSAAEFAVEIGVPLDELEEIEGGGVVFAAFPPSLAAAVGATPGLDPARLGLEPGDSSTPTGA